MAIQVERAVAKVIEDGKFPVVLGGEHTVAIGAARAIAKSQGKFSILQLDAHSDLRNEYAGSKYNHACFGRRVLELGPLVQVGIRSLSKEEKDFLPHPKIRIINAHKIHNNKDWIEKTCEALSDKVYVTVDLDVFDPAVMPSTGTPEPGGLGWYDVINLLNAVSKKKQVVGFDLVELSPIKGHEACDFLAAKLIYRFLSYIFARKKRS
jgi:agmatinase